MKCKVESYPKLKNVHHKIHKIGKREILRREKDLKELFKTSTIIKTRKTSKTSKINKTS
jgi:hypothetical protein